MLTPKTGFSTTRSVLKVLVGRVHAFENTFVNSSFEQHESKKKI